MTKGELKGTIEGLHETRQHLESEILAYQRSGTAAPSRINDELQAVLKAIVDFNEELKRRTAKTSD